MAENNHKTYLPVKEIARDKEETRRIEQLCLQGKLDSRLLGKRWLLAEAEIAYAKELAKGFIFPDLLPLAKTAIIMALIIVGLFGFQQGLIRLEPRVSGSTGTSELLAVTTPVFEKVTISLADLYLEWQNLWRFVSSEAFYQSHRLRLAWSQFGNKKKVPATAITLNPEIPNGNLDKEMIKEEIKKELLAEIERVSVGNQAYDGNNQGLVVFPASGDAARDALTQEIIKEAFSSEVSLQVDSSGRAGIITPVFQDIKSGNYLFLVTPIKTN